jgi:hypothetical protein
VAEFVLDSIIRHLDRSTFNNPGDIQALLKSLDIDLAPLDRHRAQLGAMMARRHLIAHRFDQESSADSQGHTSKALAESVAVAWLAAVESFIMEVAGIL